jgi:hypothetical protein
MRFSQNATHFPALPDQWFCSLTCGDRVVADAVFSDDHFSGVLAMAARCAAELGVEKTGFMTARVRPLSDTYGICTEFEVLLQRHLVGVRLLDPVELSVHVQSGENAVALLSAQGSVLYALPPHATQTDLCKSIENAVSSIFLTDYVGMDWTSLPTQVSVRQGNVQLMIGLEIDFYYSAHITREERDKERAATIRCSTPREDIRFGTEEWQWFWLYLANAGDISPASSAHHPQVWRAPTMRQAALQYVAECHVDFDIEWMGEGKAGDEIEDWHPIVTGTFDPERRIHVRRIPMPRSFSLGELHYYRLWEESMRWVSTQEWPKEETFTQILAYQNSIVHPVLTLDVREPITPHRAARSVGDLLLQMDTLEDEMILESNVTWVVGVTQKQTIWAIPLEHHRAGLFELGPPDELDDAEQQDYERGYPKRRAQQHADDEDDLN